MTHPRAQASDTAIEALKGALQRLEETVDQETADLAAHKPVDLAEFNRRKSRILLELTRMLRMVSIDPEGPLRDRIHRLRGKLLKNQSVLSANLSAAQAIAEVLAGVVREAESDGTYSAAMSGAGRFK